MNLTGAVDCDNSTSDCDYVEDQSMYDYYNSLMLLMVDLPRAFKTALIVLYTLTMLLSVTGNVLAIAAFIFSRGYSHTDLRWYLVNLAAADLIMAVFCMPFTFTFTMLGDWVFSAPMCPVVLFFQMLSVTASVCTSVAIGVDRFWVVFYPLRSRITTSKAPVVIGFIWIAAAALSSVQLAVGRSTSYVIVEELQVLCWLRFPAYMARIPEPTLPIFFYFHGQGDFPIFGNFLWICRVLLQF